MLHLTYITILAIVLISFGVAYLVGRVRWYWKGRREQQELDRRLQWACVPSPRSERMQRLFGR